MNHLREYFENNKENCIHKWMHYFDIYEFWFQKYVGKPVVILEIGVYQGGSLKMWRDYFGENAKIYAIDINPNCKQFESDNIEIFIGSQDDEEFLTHVKSKIPKLDILLDDGGHTMHQQITSFETLYPHIKEDGIYFCEDLHTSYFGHYGGGYKNKNSFIEYSKNLIDSLNAWHSIEKKFSIDSITKSAYSMHYYDSIFIIQKKKMSPPEVKMKGEVIIPIEEFPTPKPSKNFGMKLKKRLKNFYSKIWA